MSKAHSEAVQEVLRKMEAAYRMPAGRDRDEVIRVFGEAMEELETKVLREAWAHLRRSYSNRIFPQLGDWTAAVNEVRKAHPRHDLDRCKVSSDEPIFAILLAHKAGAHDVAAMLEAGPVSLHLAPEETSFEAGQVARAKKDLAELAEKGEAVGEASGAWWVLLDRLKARTGDRHARPPRAALDDSGTMGWWFSEEAAAAARNEHAEWLAGRAGPAMLPAWMRGCWDPEYGKGQDTARSLGSAQDRAAGKERSDNAA